PVRSPHNPPLSTTVLGYILFVGIFSSQKIKKRASRVKPGLPGIATVSTIERRQVGECGGESGGGRTSLRPPQEAATVGTALDLAFRRLSHGCRHLDMTPAAGALVDPGQRTARK